MRSTDHPDDDSQQSPDFVDSRPRADSSSVGRYSECRPRADSSAVARLYVADLELASLRERDKEHSTEASPPTARCKARSAKTAAFGRKTMHRKEKKKAL